ncbi:MAG: radical SAM protein [Clostridia bacterium]|nr:radical SAM protein [Clostridia bacterium]
MKVLQKGFNYSQDGPGNRLVYHLQGCNFRCKWCSNPESMAADYTGAENYSCDEIVDEILRSRMMFFDGGGVTFTGGEPTLHLRELKEVLIRVKEAGINTAIETNGSIRELPELSEYIDHLIMDIKQPDDEIHKKYTGCSNRQTIENFKTLAGTRDQLHIRIPLINRVNTDPAPFVNLFKSVDMKYTTVEILPYHEFGKDKWTSEYEISDGFVTKEQITHFKNELEKIGVKIINT